LTDPSIGFDILVRAIQLEAPIPIQIKMDCDEQNYSLARYPSSLVKTDLAVHNQHILPRVVSASGEHYQSSSESIFMKGDNPPLVEINGKRVSCHLEEKAML
jgi:membrane-bound inhibitor of C-type lysozyme